MRLFSMMLIISVLTAGLWAQGEIITGEYRYIYGDNETIVEARERARNLALINALQSYHVYIQSVTTVKNFQLSEDFIQEIYAGHLREVQILEQTERGREIYIKVQCRVDPGDIERIIQREIERRRPPVLDPVHPPVDPRMPFLRSECRTLSSVDAELIIQNKGFYHPGWNPSGKGIQNDFEPRRLVVIDRATGLMWQQSGTKDKVTYEDAKAYVAALNRNQFAGYSDWRLPTLEEAYSLVEPQKSSNELYVDPVFDATQRWIWTCDQPSASAAWLVNFLYGLCDDLGFYGYVRAVRSGQSAR